MSSAIRPDEFSKYAPRWVREGTAKPRDTKPLPPAPQLASVHSEDPPWRGPSPFDGDVRQWRRHLSDSRVNSGMPVLVTGRAQVGMFERLFRTAAVVSFAVIAMGALGLVLFPDAPREAFQSRGQSLLALADSRAAAVSQREKFLPAKSSSRVGVPDAQPAAPAVVSTRTPDPAPVAAPAPQPAPAFVVASANPAYQPQPQQSRPQIQQPADTQPVAWPQQAPQAAPAQPVRVQTVPIQPMQAAPAQSQQASVQSQQASVQSQQTDPGQSSLGPQRVHSQRILSPDELDRLISRGEAFLAQGDVSAARLVLVRAAEARDPRAALALGSTYDPNVLRRMGVVGVQPDQVQARMWYERAAEFGSGEATQRLTALAQLNR
jgi:outer membrane biosynthesis protein TonB